MAAIYLAAPWVHRDAAKAAAGSLRLAGHTITEPWWDHPDTSDPSELARQANADYIGVINADVLMLLNLVKSEGKAVEQGIALAHTIPIVAVGARGSNIFQHLPDYTWVSSIEEAIHAVENVCPKPA